VLISVRARAPHGQNRYTRKLQEITGTAILLRKSVKLYSKSEVFASGGLILPASIAILKQKIAQPGSGCAQLWQGCTQLSSSCAQLFSSCAQLSSGYPQPGSGYA
jgi:hypothetical protein